MYEIREGLDPDDMAPARENRRKYPIDELGVGQHFIVPLGEGRSRGSLHGAVAAAIRRYRLQHPETRFTARFDVGENALRVFRLEDGDPEPPIGRKPPKGRK